MIYRNIQRTYNVPAWQWNGNEGGASLDQDVSHGLNVYKMLGIFVSTRVGVIVPAPCTKSYSGVTLKAVILIVTKDTNSSFAQSDVTASRVEPFLVTVGLQ